MYHFLQQQQAEETKQARTKHKRAHSAMSQRIKPLEADEANTTVPEPRDFDRIRRSLADMEKNGVSLEYTLEEVKRVCIDSVYATSGTMCVYYSLRNQIGVAPVESQEDTQEAVEAASSYLKTTITRTAIIKWHLSIENGNYQRTKRALSLLLNAPVVVHGPLAKCGLVPVRNTRAKYCSQALDAHASLLDAWVRPDDASSSSLSSRRWLSFALFMDDFTRHYSSLRFSERGLYTKAHLWTVLGIRKSKVPAEEFPFGIHGATGKLTMPDDGLYDECLILFGENPCLHLDAKLAQLLSSEEPTIGLMRRNHFWDDRDDAVAENDIWTIDKMISRSVRLGYSRDGVLHER